MKHSDRFLFLAGELITLLVLLGLGWKIFRGMDLVSDIGLYDEAWYLAHGLEIPSRGFPGPEWGPLYSLWYLLLSLVGGPPDRIGLYFLNFKITSVMVPLVFYVFMRVWDTNFWFGTLGAFLFMVSSANVFLWPRATALAAAMMMVSMILYKVFRDEWPLLGRTAVVGGFFLASYVRPEAYLGSLACALYFLVSWWRSRALSPILRRRDLACTACVCLALAGLLGCLGAPWSDNSGRSFFAFSQHFAINFAGWTDSPWNPSTNIGDAMHQAFGESRSVRDALLASPWNFFRHVFSNLLSIPGAVFENFFIHLTLVTPQSLENSQHEALALLLLLSSLLVLKWRNVGKVGKTGVKESIRIPAGLFPVAVAASLPSFIGSVAIYPRDHYLVIPGLMATVVLGSILFPETDRSGPECWWGRILLFVLLAAFCPEVGKLGSFQRPVLETLKLLSDPDKVKPGKILEAEGGYDLLLPPGFGRVAEYDKPDGKPFPDFVFEKGIEIVVESELLRDDRRFCNDPGWIDFQKNPEKLGFKKSLIPGTPWFVYLKSAK